jgi:predicted alpha/beta hydrolase family esterase
MYHIQKATRSLQRVLNLIAARSGAHVASKGLLNQKRHYRLVALHGHETAVTKDKEITLYIKGFIARKGNSDNYEGWLASHRELVVKEDWGKNASAFYWESEKIHVIPAYSILYLGYKLAKLRAIHPIGFLTAVLGDAALVGVQVLNEYRNIEHTIKYNLMPLVGYLKEFSQNYETVRVVAHSTGCKLLTEALREIAPQQRPHYVHLCAPALTEKEVEYDLSNMAQKQTSVYYSPRDLVLNAAYTVFWNEDPIGVVGLKKNYDKVKTVDVDRYFDWAVHNNYASRFHIFASEYIDIADIKNRPENVLNYIQERDGSKQIGHNTDQPDAQK